MNFKELMQPVQEKSVFYMKEDFAWGGTMAKTADGKCHLIFSKWPREKGFSAWVTDSELGYAIADNPLGPYEYKGVALSGNGGTNWDADVIHNPTMLEYEGKYYLYYMGNKGNGEFWDNRNNQRIGVAVADHPGGPWTTFKEPVMNVTEGSWDHLMVSNPTVAISPAGKIVMVYKGVGEGTLPVGGPVVCGVAEADHPLGPFTKVAGPIMSNPENNWAVEDPFIWCQDNKFYALVKDFQGYFTKAGKDTVALFESEDGREWKASENPCAFTREIQWKSGEVSTVDNLERPQIWSENGVPTVLLCAMKVKEDTYNVQISLKKE